MLRWLWDRGPYFLLSFAPRAAHSSSPFDPHGPLLSFRIAGVCASGFCPTAALWTHFKGLCN